MIFIFFFNNKKTEREGGDVESIDGAGWKYRDTKTPTSPQTHTQQGERNERVNPNPNPFLVCNYVQTERENTNPDPSSHRVDMEREYSRMENLAESKPWENSTFTTSYAMIGR